MEHFAPPSLGQVGQQSSSIEATKQKKKTCDLKYWARIYFGSFGE